MKENEAKELTFWDHLDELRKVLFRVALVTIILTVIAFLNKDLVFGIILAPHRSDFILYQGLNRLGEYLSIPALHVDDFNIELINIQLASQFFIHMSTSFYVGLLLASPYIIYMIFGFIRPALYDNEKKASGQVIVFTFLLFITGVLLNYFLIFPLSFRFLATYQVSDIIANKISLSSYIDTFIVLSLMLGATFEIPILAYFFAKLGLINTSLLRKYRKHAVVIILVIAAIITPTSDIFTLLLVSIPIYFLYEMSIRVVAHTRAQAQRVLKSQD